jgi:hypothetical protein
MFPYSFHLQHEGLTVPPKGLVSELETVRPTPDVRRLILFYTCYLLAIFYCQTAFYGDPSSVFDPVRGYEASYSLQRQHQTLRREGTGQLQGAQ